MERQSPQSLSLSGRKRHFAISRKAPLDRINAGKFVGTRSNSPPNCIGRLIATVAQPCRVMSASVCIPVGPMSKSQRQSPNAAASNTTKFGTGLAALTVRTQVDSMIPHAAKRIGTATATPAADIALSSVPNTSSQTPPTTRTDAGSDRWWRGICRPWPSVWGHRRRLTGTTIRMSSQEWSRPPRTRLPKKEHAQVPGYRNFGRRRAARPPRPIPGLTFGVRATGLPSVAGRLEAAGEQSARQRRARFSPGQVR